MERMMTIIHDIIPFIPFSLNGLVRNSMTFNPNIHKIGMTDTPKSTANKTEFLR